MKPITIAIQALGGQGGGVLVDWIVDLAEHEGYIAQATSVAGVAQRTGSTVYCIELLAPDKAAGRTPVLAQMPAPGEVDVLIGAELMEAARAVQRGWARRERTLLIASTHRAYAVSEKIVPGSGVADAGAVMAALQASARRVIAADMQALAERCGSVISAVLFGALAGSGALPFGEAAFAATIERAGVGGQASRRAFEEGVRAAAAPSQPGLRDLGDPGDPGDPMATAPRPLPELAASPALQPLVDRIRRQFPAAAQAMLGEGLARVVEYQDLDYGGEYLDRVQRLAASGDALVATEAARWIAVAMSYDDLPRVAELKTRAARFVRIRQELGAQPGDVVVLEDYFHPRLEELTATLPRALGAWIEASPRLRRALAPRIDRGRRLHLHKPSHLLLLRLVAGLGRWRRASLRHARETAHLEAWLARVERAVAADPAFAVELLRCRRVVKGYSDTHARGSSRFDQLMQAADRLHGRADAAPQLAALLRAALADAEGRQLAVALQALAPQT